MNGCVIPNTPIAVDFWKVRECSQARVFLLTHLHGDHVTGLTSSWNYPIYCSEVTGRLLVLRHGIREELIHTLQIGCAQIVYLDREGREQMTLTALDANHCPGAVMFLMEGYFGTILHTGDFRFCPEMIQKRPLADYSGRIDQLYLDNTYCSPRCSFPSREEATKQVVDIIEAHPTNDVILGLRKLGKETLLHTLAIHFHEYVSVPSHMLETLQILEAPDVFRRDSQECRLRVVPFHTVSNKLVARLNEVNPTIVILPTSIYCGIDARPYENQEKVFVVPYSDHSSFTELEKFVSFLKPGKIIPIVKGSSRGPFGMSIADRADMQVFQKYVQGGWNKHFEIPRSVQMYMLSSGNKCLPSVGKKRKLQQASKPAVSKRAKPGVVYNSPSHSLKSQERRSLGRTDGKENKSGQNKACVRKVFATQPASKHLSPQSMHTKAPEHVWIKTYSSSKNRRRQINKLKGTANFLEGNCDETIGQPIHTSSPLDLGGKKLTASEKVQNWLNTFDGSFSISGEASPKIAPPTSKTVKPVNTVEKVEKGSALSEEIKGTAKEKEILDTNSDCFVVQGSQGFQTGNVKDKADPAAVVDSCSNIDAITDDTVEVFDTDEESQGFTCETPYVQELAPETWQNVRSTDISDLISQQKDEIANTKEVEVFVGGRTRLPRKNTHMPKRQRLPKQIKHHLPGNAKQPYQGSVENSTTCRLDQETKNNDKGHDLDKTMTSEEENNIHLKHLAVKRKAGFVNKAFGVQNDSSRNRVFSNDGVDTQGKQSTNIQLQNEDTLEDESQKNTFKATQLLESMNTDTNVKSATENVRDIDNISSESEDQEQSQSILDCSGIVAEVVATERNTKKISISNMLARKRTRLSKGDPSLKDSKHASPHTQVTLSRYIQRTGSTKEKELDSNKSSVYFRRKNQSDIFTSKYFKEENTQTDKRLSEEQEVVEIEDSQPLADSTEREMGINGADRNSSEILNVSVTRYSIGHKPKLDTVRGRKTENMRNHKGKHKETADDSVEIGDARVEIGDARVEIGDAHVEIGDARVEIGDARVEKGDAHVEIGDKNVDTGNSSVEIGNNSTEIGDASVEIGDASVEIGHESVETGDDSVGTMKDSPEETESIPEWQEYVNSFVKIFAKQNRLLNHHDTLELETCDNNNVYSVDGMIDEFDNRNTSGFSVKDRHATSHGNLHHLCRKLTD